jgi:replicative DNA helicase
MKRLLRGIIDYGSGISQQSLAANYQRLRSSKIEWVHPADEKLYRFVSDFFTHELDIPSAKVMAEFFKRKDDVEVLERLKDVKEASVHEGANFNYVLTGLLEDQNRLKFVTLTKEALEVAQKGLEIGEGKKKERIQGVKDAVVYFQRKAAELIVPDSNARTRGDLRNSAQESWDDYELAKANPGKAFGAFMGINQVDSVCRGLKRGELWVQAAFTGELKSTVAVNWCYNLVTRYRRNVFYVSLEMPYDQIRRIICVLHSAHPRFERMGYKALDYRKVRDGELTSEEEEFYKVVLDDFENNPEYCRFEMWCPDHDVTVQDIRMETELLHKQMEVGMLCIDHGGIVKPQSNYRDFGVALNEVIRDCKKLALQFNQGESLPVLLLFQINREGKDAAEKNQGRYKLRALAYANECIAEGTLIPTSEGLLPIERVTPEMQVWSSSGWKPVLSNFQNGRRQTVTVRVSNGLELTTTPDHLFRVLTPLGWEWVEAAKLKGRYALVALGASSNPKGVRATHDGAQDGRNCVSPFILEGSREIQTAYLRRLWDTGGGISNQGNLALGMASSKKELMRQVHLLTLSLGIPCTLTQGSTRVGGKVYSRVVLRIEKEGLPLFASEIGFTEDRKAQRLNSVLKTDRDGLKWPLGELYLRVYNRYTTGKRRGGEDPKLHRTCSIAATQIRAGRKDVTQGALRRLVNQLAQVTGDSDLDFLRGLEGLYPVLVKSVVPSGIRPVRDLEVTGDHEYSTGGLLTHNCERSADVVATTYLDDNRRAEGRALCGCLKNRDNPLWEPFELGVNFSCRKIYGVDKGADMVDRRPEEMDEFLKDI